MCGNIFLRRTGLAAAAIMSIALAGCMPPLKQSFEEAPLARKINARVGSSYPAFVRDYEYVRYVSHIQLGTTSVSLFRQVFSALFYEVQELPDKPSWREDAQGLDGVIELANVDMTMTSEEWKADSPVIGRLKVFFHICLYDAGGGVVNCWSPQSEKPLRRPGYMGDASGFGEVWAAMNESEFDVVTRTTDAAIRDTIARFMIDFENDPHVKAWAEGLSERAPSR
jgi:hypothetical protein